jgi:hypothetical protein
MCELYSEIVNDVASETSQFHLLTEARDQCESLSLKRSPSSHYLALSVSADGSWAGRVREIL